MTITRSQITAARTGAAAPAQAATPRRALTPAERIITRTRDRVNSLRGWLALLGIATLVLGIAIALSRGDPLALFGAVGSCISLYVLYCILVGSAHAKAAFDLLADQLED